MNKTDFTMAMTFLGTAYNKEITQEQLSVWYEFFKDTSIEDFKDAIGRVIDKEKFMPTIAVIKSELNQRKRLPRWFEMSQEELKDYYKIKEEFLLTNKK